MPSNGFRIKVNIAGTVMCPGDEARYGDIYIDDSGEVFWDIYVPKSPDGDSAQIYLDGIKRLVPAE